MPDGPLHRRSKLIFPAKTPRRGSTGRHLRLYCFDDFLDVIAGLAADMGYTDKVESLLGAERLSSPLQDSGKLGQRSLVYFSRRGGLCHVIADKSLALLAQEHLASCSMTSYGLAGSLQACFLESHHQGYHAAAGRAKAASSLQVQNASFCIPVRCTS